MDYQGHSSSGACVVLNNILKSRGSALKNEVSRILIMTHCVVLWLLICWTSYLFV